MEKNLPRRKSEVMLKLFKSGEKVLFDLKTRQTYKLNDVGARIWSLLDGAHTLESVRKIIADEFDENVNIIDDDVEAFVRKLLSLGIIEV